MHPSLLVRWSQGKSRLEHQPGRLRNELPQSRLFDFRQLAIALENQGQAAVALTNALDDLFAAFLTANLPQRARAKGLFLGEQGQHFRAAGDDGKMPRLAEGGSQGRGQVFALFFLFLPLLLSLRQLDIAPIVIVLIVIPFRHDQSSPGNPGIHHDRGPDPPVPFFLGGRELYYTGWRGWNRHMAYRIAIDEEPAYLHVRVTGENSPAAVRNYLEEVRAACAARNKAAVLIEENLVGPGLSLLDIYQIVDEGGPRTWPFVRRIAYVDVKAAARPGNIRFAETVALNRGVNIRAFWNVEEAKAWLRDPTMQPESA